MVPMQGATRPSKRRRPTSARGRLLDLSDRLRPGVNRSQVLAELDGMFRAGKVPDPLPDGFLQGRLMATSIWGPLDAFFRWLAGLYMPWEGKTFDPRASTGTNRFARSVTLPMRLLWPAYKPVEHAGAGLLAFEFRCRVGPGALDPDVDVLKIDYDFDANPGFVIRRILDELVQVGKGVYLGKVLFRVGGRFHPIGFFSLEAV
jgi:hypothetical protein